MKRIYNFIQEKLIINKNTKILKDHIFDYQIGTFQSLKELYKFDKDIFDRTTFFSFVLQYIKEGPIYLIEKPIHTNKEEDFNDSLVKYRRKHNISDEMLMEPGPRMISNGDKHILVIYISESNYTEIFVKTDNKLYLLLQDQ